MKVHNITEMTQNQECKEERHSAFNFYYKFFMTPTQHNKETENKLSIKISKE